MLSALTLYGAYQYIKPKNYPQIEQQVQASKNLDALLVLGGEGSEHSRSNHAVKLYKESLVSRKKPLQIIVSGSQTGLNAGKCKEAESGAMEKYLVSQGVSKRDIFTEKNSIDTISNVVYSQKVIDSINAKKVGLVTDRFHMERGLWSAKKVLGKGYEVYPCSNKKNTSIVGKAKEKAVKYAQAIDLFATKTKAGNKESFRKYIEEKHPMTAQNYGHKAPFGAYKAGISLMTGRYK